MNVIKVEVWGVKFSTYFSSANILRAK